MILRLVAIEPSALRAAIMPVLTPHATPVRSDASALLHVLEAYIETLKAENEILTRRLAAAEARAKGAIVELSALTERLTPAGDRPKPGAGGDGCECAASSWRSCWRALPQPRSGSVAQTLHGALAKGLWD